MQLSWARPNRIGRGRLVEVPPRDWQLLVVDLFLMEGSGRGVLAVA
jgi:hypothetical protein